MKTINVALLGCGFAGNFHSNAWKNVTDIQVKLKSCMDIDLKRANDLKEKWGYEIATTNYQEILDDPEIDIVDIVLPPSLHIEYAIKAMASGKHVICEKPLTGYFGQPEDNGSIGYVSKKKMYEVLLKEMDALKKVCNKSKKYFMYAENYIYSPSITKAAELLTAKKSKILFMIGNCSIHGSTSVLSSDWKNVGGGSLMRLGSHPIAAVLYLKQIEAVARGENVTPVSVTAELGQIASSLSDEDRKHLPSNPIDVEDFANVIITFSDGTKATIIANDNTMGGIQNSINIYANDGVLKCLMTPANNMESYYIDDSNLENVYISEQLQCKTGWNQVFVAEETLRGYAYELQAFSRGVIEDKKPIADLDLAIDTLKIIYASYLSHEEGKRIFL